METVGPMFGIDSISPAMIAKGTAYGIDKDIRPIYTAPPIIKDKITWPLIQAPILTSILANNSSRVISLSPKPFV